MFLNIKRVFRFYLQLLSETFLNIKQISEILSYLQIGLRAKNRYSCQKWQKLKFFPRQIFEKKKKKKLKYQNFMTIRPVGAQLSHADRHDEANSRFRNFANAPKKSKISKLKH